jgi:predicted glycoside hydrolase/deacetylase ChbG (UPF0249 family)
MRRLSVLVPSALLLAWAGSTAASAPSVPPTVQERLGYPADARLLVLHADDTGMAHSVNRATFQALENGWITSASILVPCPWFPEVARFAVAHPEADLGVHLALTSEWTTYRWGPVSGREAVPSLLDEKAYLPLVQQPVAQRARPDEVEKELRAQIDMARAAGIRLTHLDSHMLTLFESAALLDIYRRLGRDHGLPVLLARDLPLPAGATPPGEEVLIDRILTLEATVPTADWFTTYQRMLAPLPPGVYELLLHLAEDDAEMRGATVGHVDWGAGWRQNDYDMVKSPEFRRFLEEQGFRLVRWEDLARALPEGYSRKR